MTDDERYEQKTREHIATVQHWMGKAVINLLRRDEAHDASKLEEPERSGFQAMTADKRLSELTYGSDEYRAVLREHKPTIQHHYAHNDHHPEHFNPTGDDRGISGMSLLSLLEMLCDWRAATERMRDGDMQRSLDHNQIRFGIDSQLACVLENTARELGMLDRPDMTAREAEDAREQRREIQQARRLGLRVEER